VLVASDEQQLRETLAGLLEARGLRVLTADSGGESLALLATNELQAAVVDLRLAAGENAEFLTSMRRRDPLLPILALLEDTSFESAQRALRGRASGFIAKPVAPDTFVEEVERAVHEGQIAHLQRKLSMTKAGSGMAPEDVESAERSLEASMAQLYMVFQPIVRAYDGSTFAYEALMRSRGPYSNPAQLLEVAEALGRMADLGRVVRRCIANVLADHPQRSEPVFVNLHPLELHTDILLAEDEPLLPFASRIVLEVTERARLSAAPDFAAMLEQLRGAGYRVALDDLGEGYAGLSWLVKLTPDIAKIDMSLVRDVHTSRMKRELVGLLVSVCRRARTLVVAEGVETAAEAEALRDVGCDLLQGYYYARPGPPFADGQ
jgi:EAL domain-containing protein (putative c-di-GMP-specific phosphodiesterase class I)